jgi:hypothetical protein
MITASQLTQSGWYGWWRTGVWPCAAGTTPTSRTASRRKASEDCLTAGSRQLQRPSATRRCGGCPPSGLFTHRWRLREDGTGYSGTISVVAAVYTVAEVFEFGRRLYQEDTTVQTVTFRITLDNVIGRPATGDSLNDQFSGERARQNASRYVAELPRADLAAGILEHPGAVGSRG